MADFAGAPSGAWRGPKRGQWSSEARRFFVLPFINNRTNVRFVHIFVSPRWARFSEAGRRATMRNVNTVKSLAPVQGLDPQAGRHAALHIAYDPPPVRNGGRHGS
jgi:hypothetical protein